MITYFLINGRWVFTPYLYIQLFLASAIILSGSHRKSGFAWRYSIATLIAASISLVLPAWIHTDNEVVNFFYEVFGLIVGFATFSTLFTIPYKISLSKSIFVACIAYNIQHLISNIASMLPANINGATPWSELIQILFCVLASIGLNVIVNKLFSFSKPPMCLVVILLSTIIVNDVISCLYTHYGGDLHNLIFRISSVIHCLVILYLGVIVTYQYSMRSSNHLVNLKIESTKSDYHSIKYDFEQMRIRNHDLKHFISNFDNKLSPEDVKAINAMIDQNDIYYTDVESALDFMIMKKREKCIRKDIEFTFQGDTSIMSFMRESDIYILFGNLIDNAIEATEKLEDVDRRVISLSLKKDKELIVIECLNYFDGNLKLEDGTLSSTKHESGYHGLGIKSIKKICGKYSGFYRYDYENGKFHSLITINSLQ